MVKVLNAVFGIGIAVVVYIVVLLGIQAFYPEPEYESFCNETMDSRYEDPINTFMKCPDNITVGECRALMDEKSDDKCWDEYDEAEKVYSKNFFVIASILGVILVVIAFFLLNTTNISAGVACAGIVLILWAFMRGWESTDPKVKFITGMGIAAVVITLAVIVNKKLSKK
ncbi:hypothetical protein JXA85_00185 [Candidatus Woesearchaeota archaeon]|nr:hypothetical protein [Candidatus Woesearchaeota archaeon]